MRSLTLGGTSHVLSVIHLRRFVANARIKKESLKVFAEYCRHCSMLRLRRVSGNAVKRHSVERLDFGWDLTNLT